MVYTEDQENFSATFTSCMLEGGCSIKFCVPCPRGPVCSADGDGGGEGGRLAESSTAEGQRERETTHSGKTRHGWKDGDEE